MDLRIKFGTSIESKLNIWTLQTRKLLIFLWHWLYDGGTSPVTLHSETLYICFHLAYLYPFSIGVVYFYPNVCFSLTISLLNNIYTCHLNHNNCIKLGIYPWLRSHIVIFYFSEITSSRDHRQIFSQLYVFKTQTINCQTADSMAVAFLMLIDLHNWAIVFHSKFDI